MTGWTSSNVRHALGLVKQGSNPAAAVYDSIGADFFLALSPGWLNLGLWEGDGSDPSEAPMPCAAWCGPSPPTCRPVATSSTSATASARRIP